jgi:modulator of drug activity B
MNKALLINAHQRYANFAEGKLNQSLIDVAHSSLDTMGYEVKITQVEQGYDIAGEIEKFVWADFVFIQTPVYWMSVPYLFKKYIDEVFTMGVGTLWKDDGRTHLDERKKYGSGGLLSDKKYMISTTWNAPLEALENPQQFIEGRGVDGMFLWLHKVFQFCAMRPLPTFSCHDVVKSPAIKNDLKRLEEHLKNMLLNQ